MQITRDIYGTSLTLLTDLYQLTMAYGYWKSQKMEQEAVFNLFFRRNPFKGGYTIACGLEYVIDYLKNLRFDQSDLDYLATLKGNDGKDLFEKAFLEYLGQMQFSCDIDAIPEGTVVFPHEPLIRVRGKLFEAQLIETALLNIVNFQSLIATKSARMCKAAGGQTVLEFGLRRAQGIDGGLAASRAAYIGGADATSNVLAGKIFGIPVRGTHAHSWFMSFDDELEAFQTYANAMPNNCVFLVDTYDSLKGVEKAIQAGKILQAKGYKMLGIRLDSGDLAYLSNKARRMLDEAGFQETQIVVSNDLDEDIINSLKQQESNIDVWGIGTKMVTAYDQPALGGVYKITAIKNKGNDKWNYRMKLSEQAIKISNPGILQVRRFYDQNLCMADMIFDEEHQPSQNTIIDPFDPTRQKNVPAQTPYRDLLVPVFRKGQLVYQSPDIHHIRTFCKAEVAALHPSITRFANPHEYPVGLEQTLHHVKTDLIVKLRRGQ